MLGVLDVGAGSEHGGVCCDCSSGGGGGGGRRLKRCLLASLSCFICFSLFEMVVVVFCGLVIVGVVFFVGGGGLVVGVVVMEVVVGVWGGDAHCRLRSDGTGAGSAQRLECVRSVVGSGSRSDIAGLSAGVALRAMPDGADAAFAHSPGIWVRSVSVSSPVMSVVVVSSNSASTGSSLIADAGVAAGSVLSSKYAAAVSL